MPVILAIVVDIGKKIRSWHCSYCFPGLISWVRDEDILNCKWCDSDKRQISEWVDVL